MKIWAVVLILIAAFVGVGAISIFSSGVGVKNTCVSFENKIKAQYDQNQNNYDKMFKTIVEQSQVSDMYVSDLKSVFTSASQGRYGKNGSKAVIQFIHEHNPNLDSAVYTRIQQTIDASHLDFEQNQKSLIDIKQTYESYLQSFPNSLFVSFLGYPKITLADYGIVTSERTDKAFATKKDEPFKLR